MKESRKELIRLKWLMLFSLISCSPERRDRILLVDSGVDRTPEISPYFCKDGHLSFLSHPHHNAFEDSTGHGNMMAKVLFEKINPNKQCIVLYKVYPGVPAPEAYAAALIEASKHDFKAVVVALEDVGYYEAEVDWFKKIVLTSRVFVAAGNGNQNLSEKCDIYPACLSDKINSKNFVVVGSDISGFNYGGPISVINSPFLSDKEGSTKGTSISTARAAADYMRNVGNRNP